MKTTTNMGLNVPELTDVADITKLSSNFEILDEKCVRTDGNNSLTGTNSFSGAVTVASSGGLAVNGLLTASNTGNSLKVANHDTVLTSNDVLSAKDINEVNGSANNLLHRSGDETKSGILNVEKLTENIYFPYKFIPSGMTVGQFCEFLKIERKSVGGYHLIEFIQSSNTGPCYGRLLIHEINGESVWVNRCFVGANNPLTSDAIHICKSSADNYLHFFYKRVSIYGGIMARRVYEADYSTNRTNNTTETWIPFSDLTIVDAFPDTMTEIAIKEPYQA